MKCWMVREGLQRWKLRGETCFHVGNQKLGVMILLTIQLDMVSSERKRLMGKMRGCR